MSEQDKSFASAYHEQWAQGFEKLNFQKRLEDEYRFCALHSRLVQIRLALVLAMIFTLAFVLMDFSVSEGMYDVGHALRRTAIIEALLTIALLFSFQESHRRIFPIVAAGVSLGSGLAILVLRGDIPSTLLFPGCFVVTIYLYFLLGLRWRPAMAVSGILFGCFVVVGYLKSPDLLAFANAMILLTAANAMGAWGLYDLEYNRRRNFLKSKMLTHLVERDPLTGLANRKALDWHLENAWQQCAREQRSLVVALVDVDHFKAYNDTYGHQAGDRCLTHVAASLSEAARRPRDTVGRYGGEEFMVVLPEATEFYAVVLLDDIRNQIYEQALVHAGAGLGVVTVSVGVAFCEPHCGDFGREDFVRIADQALYKAKSEGRNRLVLGVQRPGACEQLGRLGDSVSIAFTSPV